MTVVPKVRETSASKRAERERVGRVEPGRRLVGNDRKRFRGERAGERGALALARRELGHGSLGVLFQADGGDRLRRGVRRQPAQLEPDLRVLASAEERHEADRLADERDRAPPQLGASRPVESRERYPIDEDVALVGKVEPGEEVEQRRLPGPRGPGDRGDRPGGKGRVEALDRRDVAEPPRHPARHDRLCSCNTSSPRNGLVERSKLVLQEH